MSRAISIISLVVTAVLAIALGLVTMEVSELRTELAIEKAVAAHYADIRLLDNGLQELYKRTASVEMTTTNLTMAYGQLDSRQPEVTKDQMVEFSNEISAAFGGMDARISDLEKIDMKRRF